MLKLDANYLQPFWNVDFSSIAFSATLSPNDRAGPPMCASSSIGKQYFVPGADLFGISTICGLPECYPFIAKKLHHPENLTCLSVISVLDSHVIRKQVKAVLIENGISLLQRQEVTIDGVCTSSLVTWALG
jgi:hypothetical protein